jgi:hypothetical protein
MRFPFFIEPFQGSAMTFCFLPLNCILGYSYLSPSGFALLIFSFPALFEQELIVSKIVNGRSNDSNTVGVIILVSVRAFTKSNY